LNRSTVETTGDATDAERSAVAEDPADSSNPAAGPGRATMGSVTSTSDELDDLDRNLLNAVQWDFPLEPRPFAALAERLEVDEPLVRARVRKVKDAGVLRQLSAIFDTRALGYTSALVAAKVDDDRIDEAAAVVSDHPGVSHNYKHNHAYNLWYTVAVPPHDALDEHVDQIHRESGALVTRKLPTITLYKIGVKLDMTGSTAADAKATVLEHERPERKAEMPVPDLSELELATIRVVQHDLPVVERPFAAYGELIGPGVSEHDVLAQLRAFKERKLMRRFAAVMNHRTAGFKANAMGVWAVPEQHLAEIGPQMAGFAAVSHCYRRPTYDDWPYSVFTMIHGRNARDCEATVEAIRDETGIDEYCLLWSVKEYKKVRLEYFTPEWQAWSDKHLAHT
jgi:siroheme decarboxylase